MREFAVNISWIGIGLVLIGFLKCEYETMMVFYFSKAFYEKNLIIGEDISHLSEGNAFPFNLQTPPSRMIISGGNFI